MAIKNEEKKELREKALKSVQSSPNLNDMISVRLDDKTLIYFRKGTTEEKIKERIKTYANRKFDFSGE